MPYPARLKRLEELSLHDIEALRLILSGGSLIDWHRLNLVDEAGARRFIENHELLPDEPKDAAFIEHVKREAVSYLRRHFAFAIPKPVEEASVTQLLLLASSKGHRQVCACTILKVVQIINHMAGRELLFLDSPGHARHHVVVRDSRTGHIFAGDTFGISYRELDQDGRQYSFPTTSPSQFDPPRLQRSIDRILSLGPEAVYVAHFGKLTNPTGLAADLHRLIDAHAELGERHRRAGAERKRLLTEGVRSLVLDESKRHGWRLPREKVLEVFALDIELNAQGIESWLDAEEKSSAKMGNTL